MSSYTLYDYATGSAMRSATEAEYLASASAAETDGGSGVIIADGVSAYVSVG